MKKNLLLSLAITLLFSISAWADPGTKSLTVSIDENIQEKAGIIEVPVYLVFEPGAAFVIGSFNIDIEFNTPDVIISDLVAVPSFDTDSGAFEYEVDNDIISISWAADGTLTPVILSGDLTGNIFFTLQFEGQVGTSSFTFLGQNDPLITAFYEGDDGDTDQINAEFNNGSIDISPAIPLSNWPLFVSAGLIILFMALRAIRLF